MGLEAAILTLIATAIESAGIYAIAGGVAIPYDRNIQCQPGAVF